MKTAYLFSYTFDEKICYVLSYGETLQEAQKKVEDILDINKDTEGIKVYLTTLL